MQFRVGAALATGRVRLLPWIPWSSRRLAIVLLAVGGLSCAFMGLAVSYQVRDRVAVQLRENGTSAPDRSFTFARQAWQAMPVDTLFPPVISTRAAPPEAVFARSFTRIGVAAPTDCDHAFDPGLARMLARNGCGPVLRATYTDRTESIVATVGVAVLGTTPKSQRELSRATAGVGTAPRAVAFPGTPAADFGDEQLVARRMVLPDDRPYAFFAVAGFSDGRPATAVRGPEAVDQVGARYLTDKLVDLLAQRAGEAVEGLRSRASA